MIYMDAYQSAKEEIKRAADIVELVGQYVQLKKAGQNFLGLCPFHSEKTPSFTVSPSKQMFHCFGCKKGGDIFGFWMEYHKASFPQAMRDLADRYHITLPKKKFTPAQKRAFDLNEFLVKINGLAAEYFHQVLLKVEKGRPGYEYLSHRSISKKVIQAFQLGYAPEEWNGLVRFLTNNKINMAKATQAGLVIPKQNGGYYDRFRGRVMFPIHDLRGRVVGFGGRVLDESLPKYLNTPETPVFHKGKLLYGIHAAYQSIRQSGRAVIVEGYTDVLALRDLGLNEAVATLGTALTKDHVRILKGYAKEVIVVFDADIAGKGAALKSYPLFLNEGLSSRVMVLPEGDDPDSFIRKNGLDAFINLLDEAVPMFEFFLDLKLSQIESGVEGQATLLKEMLPILSELDSDSHRSLCVQHLSSKSGIAESIVMGELRNQRKDSSGEGYKEYLGRKLSETKAAKNLTDLPLLDLISHFPHTIGRLKDKGCESLLTDPMVIEIFESVFEVYENEGEIPATEILEKMDGDSARELFREVLLSPSMYKDDTVEQALKEFEKKALKIKLSESFLKAKDNLEEKNQLLMLKSKKIREQSL